MAMPEVHLSYIKLQDPSRRYFNEDIEIAMVYLCLINFSLTAFKNQTKAIR